MFGVMVLNPGQTLELPRSLKKKKNSNAQAPPGLITLEFGVGGTDIQYFKTPQVSPWQGSRMIGLGPYGQKWQPLT